MMLGTRQEAPCAGRVTIACSTGTVFVGPFYRHVKVSINGQEHHNFVVDAERGTVTIGDDANPAWVVALRSKFKKGGA